jgi:hypothetical protein
MQKYLYEGDIVEIPQDAIFMSKEAGGFIHGFLFGGGEIVDYSCRISSPFMNYLLWLKDCFGKFSAISFIKEKEKTWRQKYEPRSWIFETKAYKVLGQFSRLWYRRNQKIFVPDCIQTPIALFFLYLNNGLFYKYKGNKIISLFPSFPVTNSKIAAILTSLEIHEFIIRQKNIFIKETGQEKFFAHILSHNFAIPECFKRKFPSELLNNHN